MNNTIKLMKLPDLTVIKHSGEGTQFYAYKINFILEKLNLSENIINDINRDFK